MTFPPTSTIEASGVADATVRASGFSKQIVSMTDLIVNGRYSACGAFNFASAVSTHLDKGQMLEQFLGNLVLDHALLPVLGNKTGQSIFRSCVGKSTR
jgi:hypothetical protein